jgi:hypothetical protein
LTAARAYIKKYGVGNEIVYGIGSVLYHFMANIGIDKFEINELEELTVDKLNDREQYWIAEKNCIYPLGYNLQEGGSHVSHNETTRKLIAQHSVINNARIIDKLRSNEVVKGLPVHCIYVKRARGDGVAINKHPLCSRKTFFIKTYGGLDNAIAAMTEFLKQLESGNTPVMTPSLKKKLQINQTTQEPSSTTKCQSI